MSPEVQGIWVVLGLLASAGGFGFVFLLMRSIQDASRLESTASTKYVNDEFYRREFIDLKMENIQRQLDSIDTTMNKILLRMESFINTGRKPREVK